MYMFDLSTVMGWLTAVYKIINGVLHLDPATYEAVLAHPQAGKLALLVLLLAALSYSIGHSVVLFVNRVERKRFIFSFIMSTLITVLGVMIWTLTIWITAVALFNFPHPIREATIVVSISFAPFIFGIFIITPYLGHILEYVLRIWALLAALIGAYVTFNLPIFATLFSGFLGWILFEIISNIAVLEHVERWFWRKAAGQTVYMDSQEAVDLFIKEIQTAVSQPQNDGSRT